jgi:cytochrome c oxidase cbb3-type subunit 3
MTTSRSEDELLLDHDYDGIRELDNRLPGWWLWLFYLTTIYAGAYLLYYHVLHKGRLSAAQYAADVAEAERLGLGIHYQAWGPAVTPASDAGTLAAGQALFVKNCVVCHGAHAEGNIGPNLTDEWFLHGDTFPQMIKVIEDGVPDKGMLTWKTQLSREDLRAVASYAYSLRGTHPPKAKAPQGVRAGGDGTPPAGP